MVWALIRVYNGILVVVQGKTRTRPVCIIFYMPGPCLSLHHYEYAIIYTYQGPNRLVYRMSHLVSLPEAKELLRTDIKISRHGPGCYSTLYIMAYF